ncbi:hypothetical protein JCM10207_007700 [Rhodosporidiobolus poonsookiae]
MRSLGPSAIERRLQGPLPPRQPLRLLPLPELLDALARCGSHQASPSSAGVGDAAGNASVPAEEGSSSDLKRDEEKGASSSADESGEGDDENGMEKSSKRTTDNAIDQDDEKATHTGGVDQDETEL